MSSSEYLCLRTPAPILIDGDLTKQSWTRAARSPRFGDMVTGDPGYFDTRAAALWDDQNLYVAFWIEEPFVEAALTERDSLIFNENDVELFIDGGDCYYEFEINALGTVYEVFFVWQDAFQNNPTFSATRIRYPHSQGLNIWRRLRPPAENILARHTSPRFALGLPRLGLSRHAVSRARRR